MSELNTRQQQAYSRLIQQREKNVLEALESEMDAPEDLLVRKALSDQGFDQNGYEARQSLRQLERDRQSVRTSDDDQIVAWRAELERVDEEVDDEIGREEAEMRRKVEALKYELEKKRRELKASVNARKEELSSVIDRRILEIVEEHFPGLTERYLHLKDVIPQIERIERQAQMTVTARVEALNKSRTRLQSLVRDASTNAQMKILSAKSPEEAEALVNQIPTVAELISIAQDPEGGLLSLVHRFNPSHQFALEAPKVAQPEEQPIPVTLDNNDNITVDLR